MTEMPLPRIGFLLKTYPKISETFILGEILGLEQQGVLLHILSLQRPTDEISHASTAAVRAPVSYVLAPSLNRTTKIAIEQARLAILRPLRYARALKFALARAEGGGFRQFLQAGTLALAAHEAGIEHIHAHFASEPAAVAELASKLTDLTYSISAHAKDIYLSQPDVLRRKIASARFTVTCTDYNHRHLHALAGPSANVRRMYHGVDVGRFRPAIGIDRHDPPLILSVGRLREKKGFPTLIQACAQLADQSIPFECQIVGYGPDAAKLQTMIDAQGLGTSVKLVGKLTHEELSKRYRAASVFALPCQVAEDGDRDGIPNVLLEAMATELPVISTDISGIPEVVETGVNGLVIPPEDPGALASSIAQLIGDPGLCARLGKAGRATVMHRFSNDANLALLRDLLLRAAGRGALPETSRTEERLYAR